MTFTELIEFTKRWLTLPDAKLERYEYVIQYCPNKIYYIILALRGKVAVDSVQRWA
jgi:hypothetical protein